MLLAREVRGHASLGNFRDCNLGNVIFGVSETGEAVLYRWFVALAIS